MGALNLTSVGSERQYNVQRRRHDTTKKMSTTVIQYVLKYIQNYWLNVAKMNSQEGKTVSNKKRRAWFSKPQRNYRDRSKLPKRFCPPTIYCIIEFPAILLILYLVFKTKSSILLCRY